MFSVIITTCERSPEILREAIESVMNQSYLDRELIIVNDAPQYKYRSELEAMISEYGTRIKYYVNSEKKGANYSRNYGESVSKGEYISFLDDDDYWAKTRIEKVVKAFEEGADIVYSDFYIFSPKKTSISIRKNPDNKDKISEMLAFNYLGGFSNVSIRKSLFEQVGRLDETLPAYQDQDLFIRLVQCGVVKYIHEPLSYYRINENSISLNGEKKLKGLQAFLKNYNDLFDLYPSSKIRRLEGDLVYSEKQGWRENSKIICNYLKGMVPLQRVLFLRLQGKLKYIAIKYFKMQ